MVKLLGAFVFLVLVAFHNREAGKDDDAFGATPWKHAQTLMAKDPAQFRLPLNLLCLALAFVAARLCMRRLRRVKTPEKHQ